MIDDVVINVGGGGASVVREVVINVGDVEDDVIIRFDNVLINVSCAVDDVIINFACSCNMIIFLTTKSISFRFSGKRSVFLPIAFRIIKDSSIITIHLLGFV